MASVKLTGDVTALTDLEKEHIPYALSRALQDVGQVGKKKLNEELTSSFKSPTKFTQKGAFGTDVDIGETNVRVGVKDIQAEYLDAEFFGGNRTRRPFESRLKTKFGAKFAIPTENAPKDRYGNVPPGLLKQMLKDAQASANGYYVTDKTVRFRAKGQKESTAMFNLIDGAPKYNKAIDLDSTQKAIEEAWPGTFDKQLANAIANPKKKRRK